MSNSMTIRWLLVPFMLTVSGNSTAVNSESLSPAMESQAVKAVMHKVAGWQMAQYNIVDNTFYDDASADGHPQGWVYAALYAGLAKWALMTDSPQYIDALRNISERNKWTFAPRLYNADDYAIGQLYINLYELDKKERYLIPLKTIFEVILTNPSTVDLAFVKAQGLYEYYDGRKYSIAPCKYRWCWADALFMGPPVWTYLAKVTGDQRYLDFSDKEFWATADYLFDQEEHLFYRDSRYFDQREANGAKVFWGRGNGWVFAGLARILDNFPEDHPSREKYEDIFKKMATKLITAQTEDGYWRASILAPDSFSSPETSGTGFITYGLAWGVNNGLLDVKKYKCAIQQGWQGLVRAVHKNGKLGWVQQVASAPGSATFDDSQLYGVGAFLLAGAEMYLLTGGQ